MIMDDYKILLDTKCNFYLKQITRNIAPTILNKYCQNDDDLTNRFPEEIGLVELACSGSPKEDINTYTLCLQKMYKFLPRTRI